MTTIINASNGSTSGLITTADASGVLQLQTNNGTPALTLNTTQALGVGSTPTYGTSGQVLTSAGSGAAPTWTTPSAGAMTLISTKTANNTANTISWTGLSGYNTYFLVFNSLTYAGTSTADIDLYVGTGAGPTYITSNYNTLWSWLDTSTATPAGTGLTAQSYGEITGRYILPQGSGGTGLNGSFVLNNFNSGYFSMIGKTDSISVLTYTTMVDSTIMQTGTAGPYTAIQLFTRNGGTPNFYSGTVSLYGISS